MSGFLDVYLPLKIRAYPWTSIPKFSTTITAVASGAEHRNSNWKNPLHSFKAVEAVRCHEDLEDLLEHFWVMSGPAYAFPIRDPLDFASCRLVKANQVPDVKITDQVIGIGDGLQTIFSLQKTYTRGPYTKTRSITLPIVETVIVGINALPADTNGVDLPGGPYTFDVVRETGEIIFDHPPQAGEVVSAGFLFDVPARFLSDDALERTVVAFETDGFADLEFQEIRPCTSEGSSE